jgi:hypothetical protein
MRSVAVKCDADSAARLQQIATLWPRVIGSQQSNLLDDAFTAFVEVKPNHEAPRNIRFDRNAICETDLSRLVQLAKLWPGLDRHAQIALVERVQLVTGSVNAA